MKIFYLTKSKQVFKQKLNICYANSLNKQKSKDKSPLLMGKNKENLCLQKRSVALLVRLCPYFFIIWYP